MSDWMRRHITRDFVIRHGLALWIIALVVAVPAAVRTVSLYRHLRSDIAALLPRDTPSVHASDELRSRLAALSHMGVVVDTGDAARLPDGERFIDELTDRIEKYPRDLVARVRKGDDDDREFLEKNAAAFVDVDDLKEIKGRIERRRDYDVKKETGAMLEDDEPVPPLDFSDIRAKYDDRFGGRTKTEHHRFSKTDLHATLLVIDVADTDGASERLFTRVKADVAALDPNARGLRVGYTGDVAISVEETSALKSDLSISSVLVLAFVAAVIAIYFRWRKSVLVLVPPLLVATVLAFGLASLPPFDVSELNSNTAFLGSIIVGNGINFGIVLLARYVEERRAGSAPSDAMVIAMHTTRAGTFSAALAASVSYAALASTDFQGFRQFGIIGGAGMVLSWIAAYTLMPSLAIALDRGSVIAVSERHGLSARLVQLTKRAPLIVLAVVICVTCVCVLASRRFGPDSIESDYSKLRRRDTWTDGEGYWGRKMDAVLGTYLTPIVVLGADEEDARDVADDLRAKMKHGALHDAIAQVRTLDDVVPVNQPAKLAVAAEIREMMTPKMRSLVAEKDREELDRILGHEDARVFGAADVPAMWLTGLREKNGQIGRTVLVFPKPSRALWRGQDMIDLVHNLRASAGEDGVAGALPVSADILTSIRKDGPRATLLAFIGVAFTVMIVFRKSLTSALVLGSLLVGVTWLLGASILLGVRINFANFIAFPITFGIGVDYSVNVISRWEADGRKAIGRAVRTTGSAVALCSLTTIIGYASLLFAQNQALFLFGVLAVLGEVCCLTTALVALPSLVLLIERWRGTHTIFARRERRNSVRR